MASQPFDAGPDETAAAERAAAQADRWAERAGVRMVVAHSHADCVRAERVFEAVWGPRVLPAALMTATAHSGGYVALALSATDPGEVRGAIYGFRAGSGHPELHSHMAGVLPGTEAGGVGTALKTHQRAWCLAHGIDRVTWTCDPLVRRNGWFNLRRLGATYDEYLPNFYGEMPDEINAGDESDRVMVTWRLDSDRVDAALGATPGSLAGATSGSRVEVLPGSGAGDPRASGIPTPEDIEGLRRTDRAAALDWRYRIREALAPALAGGAAVVSMTASGAYLLNTAARPDVGRERMNRTDSQERT